MCFWRTRGSPLTSLRGFWLVSRVDSIFTLFLPLAFQLLIFNLLGSPTTETLAWLLVICLHLLSIRLWKMSVLSAVFYLFFSRASLTWSVYFYQFLIDNRADHCGACPSILHYFLASSRCPCTPIINTILHSHEHHLIKYIKLIKFANKCIFRQKQCNDI